MFPTGSVPPPDASYFAKLAQFPQYAQADADSIRKVNEDLNSQAKKNFSDMCSLWLGNALNHGIAAAGPKPIAPAAIITRVLDTADGIWVWKEAGDPVAVCPDPDFSNVHTSGSTVSKAPPSQLDLIQAMLQQVLLNQATAARK